MAQEPSLNPEEPEQTPRQKLQAVLETLLGSSNVYFQPPASLRMQYPCIVYSRDRMDMEYANNGTYARKMGYQVTYIDRHPDSTIPDKILDLPLCKHDRFFTADNLNHDVFTLFF